MSVAHRLLLALAACAGLTCPAFAACTAGTQGVNFGGYDTLAPTPHNGAGSIEVTCDTVTAFDVALSTGMGTYMSRRMSAGGAVQLRYNLYADAARTLVWADGAAGSGNVSPLTGARVLTVFGRIPALQNVPPGIYVDSITVTVSF